MGIVSLSQRLFRLLKANARIATWGRLWQPKTIRGGKLEFAKWKRALPPTTSFCFLWRERGNGQHMGKALLYSEAKLGELLKAIPSKYDLGSLGRTKTLPEGISKKTIPLCADSCGERN